MVSGLMEDPVYSWSSVPPGTTAIQHADCSISQIYRYNKIEIPILRESAQGSVTALDRLALARTVQKRSKSPCCSLFHSVGIQTGAEGRERRDLLVRSGEEAAHKIVGEC
jgi:hypothetical protein